MSLKRILGAMLATRMAGRGRRGSEVGTSAMFGGVGYRRSSRVGSKMGLASLGYMAYRAYQDYRSQTLGAAKNTLGSSSAGGKLADMVQNFAYPHAGSQHAESSGIAAISGAGREDLREDERAAESFSDHTALLLIRGMITAAYADGAMLSEERQRILQKIEEVGADDESRHVLEGEIANPKPLDNLLVERLVEVHHTAAAEEFYLASRAAVDGQTDANRAYLTELRKQLGLSEQQAAEVEELVS